MGTGYGVVVFMLVGAALTAIHLFLITQTLFYRPFEAGHAWFVDSDP